MDQRWTSSSSASYPAAIKTDAWREPDVCALVVVSLMHHACSMAGEQETQYDKGLQKVGDQGTTMTIRS